AGFIDANNWLFTSRGIPVVYYGSEIGFRAGADQHSGNRDYFGQQNVELAKRHPIRSALARIAAIRRASIALQRGLQLNLQFADDTAAFMRVYQKDGVSEVALVLLNKSDKALEFDVSGWLFPGLWRSADGDEQRLIAAPGTATPITVPTHGVKVFVTQEPLSDVNLISRLRHLQGKAVRN
ncbi:MAG: cyclomaltodextrin glucanotransferase, partial [Gammaproteobacteria bacterium]|nr:cyclomaltodextrin glucanotransferase [Gammaproteobacteria bacterium]